LPIGNFNAIGRPDAGYTAVSLRGSAIRTQARQLAPKYNHIIIDVGGRDTGSLRAALTVAELVVVPVQPRSFDLSRRTAAAHGGGKWLSAPPAAQVLESLRIARLSHSRHLVEYFDSGPWSDRPLGL
jgi:hypothetical protein